MKRLGYVLSVCFFLGATACGTATAPPTDTALPPTAAPTSRPTAVPTVTATPIPAIAFSTNYRACWFQPVIEGQQVILTDGTTATNRDDMDAFIQESEVKVLIDEMEPIILKEPSLWSPAEEVTGATRTYYRSTFQWEIPALTEGKHLVVLDRGSPYNSIRGQYCAYLIVTAPEKASRQTEIAVGRDQLYASDAVCNEYIIDEDVQPLTLIDSGYADSFRDQQANFINYSIEKIWIDDGEPIVVTGGDGWGPIYHNEITYVYGSDWSWPLPVLAKGKHQIVVEWGVTAEIDNDSSRNFEPDKPIARGCIDLTIQ